MGAPSGCRVSAPVTCVAGESGALRSVAPCADQPTEEGEISNSSWPTVWPSSWMVNFPLSGAKTGAFFCACEATVLNARMHSARTPNVILDFKDLRIIEATPSAKLLLRLRSTKFATAALRNADIARVCAQSVTGEFAAWRCR